MPGAVRPFQRLRSRLRRARIYGVNTPAETSVNSNALGEQWRTPELTDLIFPKWQRELFKTILDEQKLRFDREGRPRTAYSLRHTYICLRLMQGADIYQIAKNCRTSVEMIEKYYAAHIKTSHSRESGRVIEGLERNGDTAALRFGRAVGSGLSVCRRGVLHTGDITLLRDTQQSCVEDASSQSFDAPLS